MPNINYTNINFDDIVSDLKAYIKATSDFNSYNFDSSNLTLLCNLLGYITTILNTYINQAVNENYLDSTTLRKNILSIIKLLNYTPSRTTSAIVYADLVATPTTSPDDVVIEKYQTFTAGDYTFYNTDQIIFQNSNSYTQTDIKLIEGILTQTTYTGDGTNFQEIIIDDTLLGDYVRVWAYTLDDDGNETTTEEDFSLYTETLFLETPLNAKIYFLEEVETGYRFSFGNTTFGYAPANGRIIHIDYFTSSGADANDLTEDQFEFSGSGTNLDSLSLTFSTESGYETTVSYNGASKESITSIKFNAPKFYSTQGRAVTDDDYNSIILTNSSVSKANVIGGDQLSPQELGKVYIYAKPTSGLTFTSVQLATLRTFLLDYAVVGINPIVRNPEYVYMIIDTIIRYTSSIPNITDIKSDISTYINSTTQEFGTYFKYSKFIEIINESDTLISSNLTTINLYKFLTENDNTENDDYSLYLCKNLSEDTDDQIYIEEYEGSTDGTLIRTIYESDLTSLVINETTGLITFTYSGFNFDNYTYRIKFFVEDNDIFSNFNQLLYVDTDNDLTVTFESITV